MKGTLNVRLVRRPLLNHAVIAPSTQLRNISWLGWGKKDTDAAKPDPSAMTSHDRSIKDLLKRSPSAARQQQQTPKRGSLADGSIFGAEEDELDAATSAQLDLTANRLLRDPHRSTWGWPKKSATREVRRRGRLSRTRKIARTEKEHAAASHFFKTSVKKLAPIARQIMGKGLEDAITQMRFSPKKAARDVLAHLHHARNEAVVRKAMKVSDMYVAQAWVGRGPFGRGLNHRARGRIDILKLPYTSITVILKEKATLERIAREKEEKKLRKPVRQHLPSRPIYGQRQYYQW